MDLFRKQSKSWGGLAKQHVKLVTKVTREFAVKVVEHVVEPDSKTSEAIVKDLVTPYFDEKEKDLKAKVEELLKHYRDGYDPQPTRYEEFVERVTERRNKRLVKHMAHQTKDAKAGNPSARCPSESEQIQTERNRFQSQLERLRKGLAACRRYAPRQPSGMCAPFTTSPSIWCVKWYLT